METEKQRNRGSEFLLCKNSVKGLNDTSVIMPECFCRASRSSGFTLVELVIVIAIVIVLSVVSVPIYQGYVEKAKLSEGYALLGTLLSAQKAYYSEYGNFLLATQSNAAKAQYTCYSPVLGIDARGNKYFTWFAPGTLYSERISYYVYANAQKPADLIKNGRNYMVLQYNLTVGSKMNADSTEDSKYY